MCCYIIPLCSSILNLLDTQWKKEMTTSKPLKIIKKNIDHLCLETLDPVIHMETTCYKPCVRTTLQIKHSTLHLHTLIKWNDTYCHTTKTDQTKTFFKINKIAWGKITSFYMSPSIQPCLIVPKAVFFFFTTKCTI